MKDYMLECYREYCFYCFRKNTDPAASFEDYSYIHFGDSAYREAFKKSYQGKYTR